MQVYVCFLEHFEQFEHAGERLPGAGAAGVRLFDKYEYLLISG